MSLIAPYILFPSGGGGGATDTEVLTAPTPKTTVGTGAQTFSGVSFGTAQANQNAMVIVASTKDGAAAPLPTAVTIGGNSATLIDSEEHTENSSVGLYEYQGLNSATADVVCTMGTATDALAVVPVAAYGKTAAIGASAQNFSGSIACNVNTTLGDDILTAFCAKDTSAGWTLTGSTEQSDTQMDGANAYVAVGLDLNVAAATPRSISGSNGGFARNVALSLVIS